MLNSPARVGKHINDYWSRGIKFEELICVYQVVLVVGVLLDDIEGLLAYQA
jgi:hypothetical protein